MKLSIVFVSILVCLLLGCVKEPFELKYESDKEPVVSPCEYRDIASISSLVGCYGVVTKEFEDNFDDEQININWSSSEAHLVIRYRTNEGFKSIKENMVFDLSKFNKIDFYAVDNHRYVRNYSAISGNIYFTKLPNGKLRADWCDVALKHVNSSFVTNTFGGIELP